MGEVRRDTREHHRCADFPSPPSTYLQQAYCALGKYEEALAVAEAAPAEIYPFQYPYQLALNLIYERRFEAALHEADKMLERYSWVRLSADGEGRCSFSPGGVGPG